MSDFRIDVSPRLSFGPFVLRSSYAETVADLLSKLMVAQQQIDVLSRDNVRMRAEIERVMDNAKPWNKRASCGPDPGDAA